MPYLNLDRRDSLKRATEIYLVKETESLSGDSVRERVGIHEVYGLRTVYFLLILCFVLLSFCFVFDRGLYQH